MTVTSKIVNLSQRILSFFNSCYLTDINLFYHEGHEVCEVKENKKTFSCSKFLDAVNSFKFLLFILPYHLLYLRALRGNYSRLLFTSQISVHYDNCDRINFGIIFVRLYGDIEQHRFFLISFDLADLSNNDP